MPEISLETFDRLQRATMQLESIAYLKRLLFEDNDGWPRSDDPEYEMKDSAFSILSSLQDSAIEELHEIVFKP